MTDFFETRVENLKLKEDKKKSTAVTKKLKDKTSHSRLQLKCLKVQQRFFCGAWVSQEVLHPT